jgi:hypothetical protein
VRFKRIADAELAVWDDESVLYHLQSGNSYLFRGAEYCAWLGFCVERNEFADDDLWALSTENDVAAEMLTAFLQQLIEIQLIAVCQ